MKAQDIAVALALCLDKSSSYASLASSVGVSSSEAHAAVGRLRDARIVDSERRVNRTFLLDFVMHGLPFAFPGRPGGPSLGVPTGAARFEATDLPSAEFDTWVWPSANGTVRGLAVDPLYPSIPSLGQGPLLDLLAAVDLVRMGRAREVAWAERYLRAQLAGDKTSVRFDLGGPDALRRTFTRANVRDTIAKWAATRIPTLAEHPLARAILTAYRDELADMLAVEVTQGTYRPSAPTFLEGRKSDQAARTFSVPTLLDAVVARRAIEEIEAALVPKADARVFMNRSRTSSLAERGQYRDGAQWLAFVDSVRRAANESELAQVLTTDIQEFFPSVDHAIARQVLAQRTRAHPDLIAIVFRCLVAWSPTHESRRAVGLPIEPHDISRVVAHALLGPIDEQFEDDYRARYRRFVDDTVFLVETKAEAQRLKVRYRRALTSLGLSVNATKTKMPTSREYLASLSPGGLDDLVARAKSPNTARTAYSEIANYEWKDHGHRRLYAIATKRGVSGLVDRAIADVFDRPAVAELALHYLGEQPLTTAQVTKLTEWYDDDDRSAHERLLCAETLTRAPLPDGEAVATFTVSKLQSASSDGCGHARAALLHGLVKFVPCDVVLKELDRISPGVAIGDRPFAHAVRYVTHALGGSTAGALRLLSDTDIALTERLLTDISSDTLATARAVLFRCRIRASTGSWFVPPGCLPLLVAFGRSRGACRAAFTQWCRDTLDGDRAPRDGHTANLLRSLEAT